MLSIIRIIKNYNIVLDSEIALLAWYSHNSAVEDNEKPDPKSPPVEKHEEAGLLAGLKKLVIQRGRLSS